MKNYPTLIFCFFILLGCEASKTGVDSSRKSTEEDKKIESKSESEADVQQPTPSLGQSEELVVSAKPEVQETEKGVNSGPWSISSVDNYAEEEEVKISFTNTTDQSITIYSPLRKNIERLIDSSWIPVEIVYCRCRPCPPPPETREVSPGKYYSIKWSKKEDSCKDDRFSQTDCESGLYRVSLDYDYNGKRRTEIVEFRI